MSLSVHHMKRGQSEMKAAKDACLAFGPKVASSVLKAGSVVSGHIPWKVSIQTSVRWQRMIAAQVLTAGS